MLRPLETLDEIAARERPENFYVGVERDGVLVAVGWVRPEGPGRSWRVGSMAIADSHRGQGLGRLVIAELVEHARNQAAERVWCNARLGAVGFYERQGWTVESTEPFAVIGAGEHHRMAIVLSA